jgi:hypothetical protein
MQQIADWLKQLVMSEYAERFVESDIDTSVLRDLSDQDLKELGVSLGHRRKMLRAIAELPGAAPTSPQPAFTEPKSQDAAERRQVTVMFSDLVGSTALSARMDPEDLREVISAYQKCVAETVRRFGGFVAKYSGIITSTPTFRGGGPRGGYAGARRIIGLNRTRTGGQVSQWTESSSRRVTGSSTIGCDSAGFRVRRHGLGARTNNDSTTAARGCCAICSMSFKTVTVPASCTRHCWPAAWSAPTKS